MDSLDELRDLLSKSGDRLADVFVRMIRAKAERRDSSVVFRDLTRLLTQTLAWAHLMGRRRVRIDVKDAGMRAFAAAADVSPLVPATTFEQAVEDILDRHPELAVGYEAVQKAYAEGHAFALAKSTEDIITERVQRVVAEGIKKGKGQVATAKVIEELSDFTLSYSENVFRTNAATAYAQGRYEEALDPDIAEVMPALEFVGRTSSPSRPNHIAAVGLIAATNDPIWGSFMPPLGYRCSHSIRLVSKFELQRRGLLRSDGSVMRYTPPGFHNAYPDPGFNRGTLARRRSSM